MAQHYDVAVIGGDVSQLVAALMLCRRGRRVVVVGGADDCPESNLMPCYGVGDMSFVARCHDELGITPPPTRRIKAAMQLQIILAKDRLTLGQGREAAALELRRAYPQDAAAIDDLLQLLLQQDRAICHFLQRAPRLPPETIKDRAVLWQMSRSLAQQKQPVSHQKLLSGRRYLHDGHPLQRLFVQGLMLLQDSAQTCSFAAVPAAHLLAQVLLGGSPDAQNRGGLKKLLLEAASRAGVDLRLDAAVKRMAVEHGVAGHLELDHSRQEVRADCYVYGCRKPLSALWHGASAAALRHESTHSTRLTGCWLQRRLRVTTRRVHAALGPLAWHLDGRSKGRRTGDDRADEPFVLQRMDGSDGVTELVVTAPIDGLLPIAGPDVSAMPWAQQCWARIEPRLARTLPHLPWPHRGGHVADAGGNMEMGPLRVLPQARVALQENAYLGICGRSRKTALRNVVVCNREVVPGLGLAGEYLAASGCVELLHKRQGWR